MSNLRYIISTRVDISTSLIVQELSFSSSGDVLSMRDMVTRWVINAQDAGVRESLIRLGWTPPPPGFKPPENKG